MERSAVIELYIFELIVTSFFTPLLNVGVGAGGPNTQSIATVLLIAITAFVATPIFDNAEFSAPGIFLKLTFGAIINRGNCTKIARKANTAGSLSSRGQLLQLDNLKLRTRPSRVEDSIIADRYPALAARRINMNRRD